MADALILTGTTGTFPGIGPILITVGSYQFVSLEGELPEIKFREEEISQPGQSGRTYRYLGNQSTFSRLVGLIDPVTDAAAEALKQDYYRLKGNRVRVFQYNRLQAGLYRVDDAFELFRRQHVLGAGGVFGGSIELGFQFTLERIS